MARVDLHNDLAARLAGSPAAREALRRQAALLAEEVKRFGLFERSIRHTAGIDDDGEPVGRVYSRSPRFHLAEFGSVKNPAYAPMRAAAERLGFRR